MMETAPRLMSPEEEKEQEKQQKISLSLELSQNPESFSFVGIEPEVYERMKADEARDEEEFGMIMTTPIDEIMERMKNEGIKVVLGKNPETGNVFILPAGSNDVENDSILPKSLQLDVVTDEKLKELIILDRG